MNKIVVAALALSFVTPIVAAPAFAETAPVPAAAAAPTISGDVVAAKGKMLVAADGSRIGSIYRVSDAGPQIIMEGHMVTVPANTLSMAGGKLTTSLTKSQLVASR